MSTSDEEFDQREQAATDKREDAAQLRRAETSVAFDALRTSVRAHPRGAVASALVMLRTLYELDSKPASEPIQGMIEKALAAEYEKVTERLCPGDAEAPIHPRALARFVPSEDAQLDSPWVIAGLVYGAALMVLQLPGESHEQLNRRVASARETLGGDVPVTAEGAAQLDHALWVGIASSSPLGHGEVHHAGIEHHYEHTHQPRETPYPSPIPKAGETEEPTS